MKPLLTHSEVLPGLTRREALSRMGSGFGMLGLAGALNGRLMAGQTSVAAAPLAPRQPQFPAKAKRVIFLFLNGGLSQVDTFDPKPALEKYNGQQMPGGNPRTERKTGN